MAEPGPGRWRVSFIEYLNSVPLGWGFLYGPDRGAFEVLIDVPSECARRLAGGEADVGLIPVVEYQKIPGLRILPGISIASRQEVKSVLFLSRIPLERVSRVAVDGSSRTSVALLEILLHHFYGRPRGEVHYTTCAPEPERMLQQHEAALVIGNPALQMPRPGFLVYDLAEEWNRFTGLPFVFAFWAVREGVDLGAQVEIFYRSRRLGLENVAEIAKVYSRRLGIPPEEIAAYIQENLDYSLDGENLGGLETFFELASSLSLIPSPRALEFYPRVVESPACG